MIRHLILALLGLWMSVSAQDKPGEPSPGAALLFKNVKTKLGPAEKELLFKNLNLKLSSDNKSFTMDNFPVEAWVYPTDMNKDGKEEYFVVMRSAALFGNVGQNFFLYIENKSGNFEQQTGIGAGIPVILSTMNLGYPDILVGTPNMEHPVFRWNGSQFTRYKKLNDAALNSKNSTKIETYSKAYTGQ